MLYFDFFGNDVSRFSSLSASWSLNLRK
jgi:hypothetical protein